MKKLAFILTLAFVWVKCFATIYPAADYAGTNILNQTNGALIISGINSDGTAGVVTNNSPQANLGSATIISTTPSITITNTQFPVSGQYPRITFGNAANNQLGYMDYNVGTFTFYNQKLSIFSALSFGVLYADSHQIYSDGSGNLAANSFIGPLNGSSTNGLSTAQAATLASAFTATNVPSPLGTYSVGLVSGVGSNTVSVVNETNTGGATTKLGYTINGNLNIASAKGAIEVGGVPVISCDTTNGNYVFGQQSGQFAYYAQGGGLLNTGGNQFIGYATCQQVIAIGDGSMQDNFGGGTAIGSYNIGIGAEAGWQIQQGSFNIILGDGLNSNNQKSSNNVVIGWSSGGQLHGNYNTLIGCDVLFDNTGAVGTSNQFVIAVGYNAADNYSSGETNDIDIGNAGVATENNSIHIGNNTHTNITLGKYNVSVIYFTNALAAVKAVTNSVSFVPAYASCFLLCTNADAATRYQAGDRITSDSIAAAEGFEANLGTASQAFGTIFSGNQVVIVTCDNILFNSQPGLVLPMRDGSGTLQPVTSPANFVLVTRVSAF